MIRYANDLELTDLARRIHNQEVSLQADLKEGYLGAAFLKALRMETMLVEFMERLNDIKYGRAA